jgi:hypothetical protein
VASVCASVEAWTRFFASEIGADRRVDFLLGGGGGAARSYHHPLYWAGIAGVAIEAIVPATLVWSAGAALDPGSLAWWVRTPAYAAIVVAVAAVVRTPLATHGCRNSSAP